MGCVIELKNVTYYYPLADTPAIKNASVKIEEGKFYGVTGANGAGKTTLCSLIRGFAPAFYKGRLEGEVLAFGKPVADYGEGELSLRMGFVGQNPLSQMSGVKGTLFEEVAFGLENFGVPAGEIEIRVEEAMRLANILDLAERDPFELSCGQQQRAALAAAIVLRPDVLVLDEPASQLDAGGAESVFEMIAKMKNAKKTIILAEHRADLLAKYADDVIVLNGGEIVAFGPAQDILSDMSLSPLGVRLPQTALLAGELIKRGVKLSRVPITEAQGEEVLRGLLGEDW